VSRWAESYKAKHGKQPDDALVARLEAWMRELDSREA